MKLIITVEGIQSESEVEKAEKIADACADMFRMILKKDLSLKLIIHRKNCQCDDGDYNED